MLVKIDQTRQTREVYKGKCGKNEETYGKILIHTFLDEQIFTSKRLSKGIKVIHRKIRH